MALAVALRYILEGHQAKQGPKRAARSNTHLKWLMDWRTASSNSMGPGISKVGCSGWVDILDDEEELSRLVCAGGESMTKDRSKE